MADQALDDHIDIRMNAEAACLSAIRIDYVLQTFAVGKMVVLQGNHSDCRSNYEMSLGHNLAGGKGSSRSAAAAAWVAPGLKLIVCTLYV